MAKLVICLDTSVLIDYFRRANKSKSFFKNRLIDKPDLMIAGTAMANKLKLATLNLKHFERVDGLELVQRK